MLFVLCLLWGMPYISLCLCFINFSFKRFVWQPFNCSECCILIFSRIFLCLVVRIFFLSCLGIFWMVLMGLIGVLAIEGNGSLFSGSEILMSHKLMKLLLGLSSALRSLDFILASLERIFIFFFLTMLMFVKVTFCVTTMFVANFINVFLFGLLAVSVFWFYQLWVVGVLIFSLFYYLFLTNNEFFLFLLSLLEMFSTFFQSITLANRLTINVFAGGLLLTLISLLLSASVIATTLAVSLTLGICLWNILSTIFIYLFYLVFFSFEIFVLFIQLNIFCILYEVYAIYSLVGFLKDFFNNFYVVLTKCLVGNNISGGASLRSSISFGKKWFYSLSWSQRVLCIIGVLILFGGIAYFFYYFGYFAVIEGIFQFFRSFFSEAICDSFPNDNAASPANNDNSGSNNSGANAPSANNDNSGSNNSGANNSNNSNTNESQGSQDHAGADGGIFLVLPFVALAVINVICCGFLDIRIDW